MLNKSKINLAKILSINEQIMNHINLIFVEFNIELKEQLRMKLTQKLNETGWRDQVTWFLQFYISK